MIVPILASMVLGIGQANSFVVLLAISLPMFRSA